ncbi:protein TIC 100 isoform X1 [Cucurbita moschata]|uniref:Protein TIC 100 isoform X1 n=1 Tax=Cucurbita moschata TaxID=3662 RepID=A0A6J1H060_CUCMO|nr:protein TIC 100 isoform X1 [Cucurbita moschata]
MADGDSSETVASQQKKEREEKQNDLSSSDSSESEYESDDASEGEYEEEEPLIFTRRTEELTEADNNEETNIRRLSQALGGKLVKKMQEEEEETVVYHEDLFDFPKDPENWTEEDLQELWMDAPLEMEKPGWDPIWADEKDWEVMRDEVEAGKDPPIAPFYVPYRKPYPVIPDNHFDIPNAKSVIEELDRIEEFLKWVSYIFPDGSSYEGTVWDDLAHGKGVYVAELGLVRYEGEWVRNNMEGHGVVEVDIPDIEPVPGSKLEKKMRAEGKIISRDYMTPEDKNWLEMDIEDSIHLAGGNYEIPFYERQEWIKYFGGKPEKGRYRYAGEWKHGRMHGCGVYEVNERPIWGRFYFGELLYDSTGCDEDTSALHASLAEVAAAKARMFVNKPDGMIREERGPYGDPQHPYFYEEEDTWMAPGFINQFYEVPDYWKTYVHEVDEEREMWLNSFYKAPLRLPMPAELEYWWAQDHTPEFVLVNKEPEPDPEDPSKLVYTEDPLILHTPTGRLINYVEDEEHGVRMFWQPQVEAEEDVDPEKVEFLPLGFDEFYGTKTPEKKENILMRLVSTLEKGLKPKLEKIGKWAEEKKKESELKKQLIEKELELIEAEICLEEAIEDMDEMLKRKEKEEEEKEEEAKKGLLDEDVTSSTNQDKKASVEEEGEDDEDDDDDDVDDSPPSSFDAPPSSFGSVSADQKPSKPRDLPFSTASLHFASSTLVSGVPSRLIQSIFPWTKGRLTLKAPPPSSRDDRHCCSESFHSVCFPRMPSSRGSLKAIVPSKLQNKSRIHPIQKKLQLRLRSRPESHSCHHLVSLNPDEFPMCNGQFSGTGGIKHSILSWHTPLDELESYADTTKR